MSRIQALLVTKGHPYEREPFFQMIDNLERPDEDTHIQWTHVELPAAEAVLTPETAAMFDVVVFYDMPGVTFTRGEPPFAHYDPSEKYKENFLRLLDNGKPMVFLHHAIAAWPTWPEFAEILGGRFHFLPGELNGKVYPGSGYRFRTPQTVTVVDQEHPVTKGLGASFSILDEAYLMPVDEDNVVPLLRSDFTFNADNFRMGGVNFKHHPEGSNLLGWTKMARNSPIVYLQFGHDHKSYKNNAFQHLIVNAIKWTVGVANDKTA